MKTIKTRKSVKGIKLLDKPANLSRRMKSSLVRIKAAAEGTQSPRQGSPTDYAIGNIQEKTQGMAREAAHRLPNPWHNAGENIRRAKWRFQEVKNQAAKGRGQAAGQAQKTANVAQEKAAQTKTAAGQAKETAGKAQESVKDAKHALREVRRGGRQTLREAKHNAGMDSGIKTANMPSPRNGDVYSGASGMAPPAKKKFVREQAC